ncbi:MAG: RsmE family RNA methyltransferase [Anaerovoracaceae bacterium]
MSRFFVDTGQIGENTISIDNKEDLKHITKVLRLVPGDKIDISDSTEWEYATEIQFIDEDSVVCRILDKQKFAREPQLRVTLFQGIPKQSKMEVIVQKCVEMGVWDIVPVFTKRTVVTDNGKFKKKIERWNKVSAEAVKQCKRGIIPLVQDDISFKEMVSRLDFYDFVLFPYENEEDCTIKAALENLPKKPRDLAIIIGPEGGFSDEEAEILKKEKACCVTLGKTILRTETAGLVALAMTMYALEL